MSTPQSIGDAMREISIPRATMPKELRGLCAPILQRAIEIRVSTPVVAYWCCFAAAQRAMAFKGPVPGKNQWLLSLVEVLEEMKKILGQDERVNNEAAGSAYVESFAILMFATADRMDRAGKTDIKTAQQYAIAQQFFEVLNCFDVPMSENAKEKLSYARWKIRDIGAAIREGRTPVSGPPIPETDDDLLASLGGVGSPSAKQARSPGTGSPRRTSAEHERRGSSSSLKRPNVPPPITIDDLDGDEDEHQAPRRTVSETWSTMATPGVDDSEPRLPSPPGASATDLARVLSGDSGKSAGSGSSGHTATGPSPTDKPDKSVRFMGPDGAPLSPAQTMSTVAVFDETLVPLPSPESAYQALPPPLVPTHPPRNLSPTKPASPPKPSPPKPRAPTLPPPPPPSLASTAPSTAVPPPPPPSLASTAPPPAPPPSFASTAPPPAPPPSLASTSRSYAVPPPPPPSAVSAPAPPKVFNWRDRDQVKKHAKFAISALEFDDYDEAKSQLLRALAYFD